MKPLVSAAAAALLLVGGRRGGAPPPSSDPDDPQHSRCSNPLDEDPFDPFAPQPQTSDPDSVDEQPQLRQDPDSSPAAQQLSGDEPLSTSPPDSPSSPTTRIRTLRSPRVPRFPSPADWDWTDAPDDASIWAATAAILADARARTPFLSDDDDDNDQDNKVRSGGTFSSPYSRAFRGADASVSFRDAVETLSAALRGLGELPTQIQRSLDVDVVPGENARGGTSAAAGFLRDIARPTRDGGDEAGGATSIDRPVDSDLVVGGGDDVEYQAQSSSESSTDSNNSVTEDDEEQTDLRPLMAVAIGVTLFLLTRSPMAARRTELEAGASAGDATRLVDDDYLISVDDVDYSSLSDLRADGGRDIVIVTTAALPWMTGTAVNPLLRAVYLAKAGHRVSLVVPWLESPEDQRVVFPKGTQFATKEAQTAVIMAWAWEQVPGVHVDVRFYEGVYSKEFGSILPLGDITALFADDEVKDVCVLEEPEHLTWFHTGRRWTSLFRFCVGVVHTNYLEYAKKHGVFGPQRALFLSFLNKWVCRSYCHRIIKLSDAVQSLPHSVTCNVHGVRNKFIDIGRSRGGAGFANGAYFLGKVLWAKGYSQLVELMEAHYERTEERLPIDFFGAGPDLDAVRQRVSESYALSRVQMHGVVVDHASDYLQRYKVYVNPSKSDVVCTATAEALAMGKFVVCLKHPSNEFFATFANCLIYETPAQFSAQLAFALANEPLPLSVEDAYRLSWEAATERFYDASYVPAPSGSGRVDSALALTHKAICATLVTPPANNAVRARYKQERGGALRRRTGEGGAVESKRTGSSRSKVTVL